MKTAIELADAADAVASWLELRFYTKSSNDVKSCAERLRELSKENEALLKANLDCVDHFNTLKTDYDALKADAERQDAKIKALRDSLTWALSNISEEHYGWPSDEDAAAHNAAIAAAKETS